MAPNVDGRSGGDPGGAPVGNAGQAIIITDLEGLITNFDADAERLLGYRSADVVGHMTPATFVDPRELAARATELDVAPGFAVLVRALGVEAADTRSWTCVRADGQRVPVSLSIAALRRADEAGFVAVARDLTHALEAERPPQSELERMRAVFHTSLEPTVVSRFADGTVLSANPAFVELLGWQEPELAGRTMLEVGVWAQPETHTAIVEQLSSGRPVLDLEVEARAKSGAVKTVLASLSLVEVDDRTCVVSHIHDVTERRRLQAELRESEVRFRQVTETIQQGFLLRDLDPPTVLYASPAMERIFGLKSGTIHSRPLFLEELVHPDDRERVLTHRDAMTQATDFEFRIVRPDGETRWIRSRAAPVRIRHGTPARIAVVSEDVTEERELRETLRSSEQRFRLLAENSTDVIARASPDAVILYISPACRSLYGYEPEELVGRSGWEFIHPDDLAALRAEVAGRAVRPDEVSNEYRIRHRDGSYVWVEARSRTIRDPVSHEVVELHSSARDVSERKRAVAAIRRAKEEAEEANNAKSEFLSRMSHELRTPLHAILGFGELLERGELGPEQRQQLRQITNGGSHLLDLINEVLDLSQIELGELGLSLEPVHVGEVAREALALVETLAAARSVSMPSMPSDAVESYVLADRQRLKQVMLNLLSNAVKYNRDGGDVSVSITGDAGSPRARIEVTDTGRGIAAGDVTRAFEAFERLGAETTDVEGTGLGLALTKRLIETMGGEVGIESAVGEGTTAWIELPAAAAPVARPTRPDRIPLVPAADADEPSVSVLYVEDNVSNVKLVERILRLRRQIALLVATDGRRGLELAFERRPALVLLDHNLPDMSGEDVLRGIRGDARTAATAVVMVSADATPGQIARLRDAGVDDYLTKPFEIDQFLAVVDRWCVPGGQPTDRAGSPVAEPPSTGCLGGAVVVDAIVAADDGVPAGPLDLRRIERLRSLQPDGRAMREVVGLFLEDSDARIHELATTARDGDAKSVWRTAHAWRGACALTGAHRLAALLVDIETSAGRGDVPDARGVEAVEAAYRDTAAALARALD